MPIAPPWSKVTCPYCFAKFHLSKAPRRMVYPGAPTEPDARIQAYFGMGGAPVLGKVNYPPKPLPWWRNVYVPPTGRDERLVCPNDHIFLPENVANGQAAGEVIAVIGARTSGKSNFFGVLLNAL